MKFEFPDEDVFLIENDALVKESQGVEACECISIIHPYVALLEAKSSSPKINNRQRFDVFISEICKKFADSLLLFNGLKDKKYGEAAYLRLPAHLRCVEVADNQYQVCLIIHGHRLEWLLGLQDAFREAMRPIMEKWHLLDSNIRVYNEETALEHHLIVAYIPKAERDALREPNGNMSLPLVRKWFGNHL